MKTQHKDSGLNLSEFVQMAIMIVGAVAGVVIFCFNTFASKEEVIEKVNVRQAFNDTQFKELKESLNRIDQKIDRLEK